MVGDAGWAGQGGCHGCLRLDMYRCLGKEMYEYVMNAVIFWHK